MVGNVWYVTLELVQLVRRFQLLIQESVLIVMLLNGKSQVSDRHCFIFISLFYCLFLFIFYHYWPSNDVKN